MGALLDVLRTVRNGHIKRITDQDIQSSVLEIMGTNVSTNYITCPADPQKTLGIKLPFLVMIIKNLKKYFTFEVQVLDDKNVRRRFRASNYQVSTRSIVTHPPADYCPTFGHEGHNRHVPTNPRTVATLGVTVNDASEAVHLHDADAPGRGLEPDSVQP